MFNFKLVSLLFSNKLYLLRDGESFSDSRGYFIYSCETVFIMLFKIILSHSITILSCIS